MKQVSKLWRPHLVGSAAIAAMGVGPMAARAQAPVAPAAPGASAPQDKAAPGGLQVVTVTAQKRTENARDVSSSISVVGSQQLEDRHVTSLVDLAGALPGVQIDSGGTPGQTTISMRGIPSLDVGSVVGTYIDDAPLGSSSSFASASRYQLDLLPYDIERVEVLRGPQGTLYGASAMGGLLKYVLKEPDLFERSGAIGGGAASVSGAGRTGWDGRANVNLPLIAGQLALSVSVSQDDTPGWVDNAVTGSKDINDVTQKSSRVALRWEPVRDVSLKLSALHQSTAAGDTGVILLDPATQRPLYGQDKTGTVIAQPFSNIVDFYAATLNWDLHDMDFTSSSSYSHTRRHSVKDDTSVYGPVFGGYGFSDGRSPLELDAQLHKFTQEFRLASKPGGRVEWLAGAFFTHEASGSQQLLGAKAADGSALPVLDPLLGVILPSTYKEGALFGDLTYKLTDRFDITGGLRYAKNWQRYTYDVSGIGATLEGLTDSGGKSSEGVTTWMFSPRYRLGADSMVYLRAAKGYRAGSPNLALPGVPPTVNSDTLINYEAGWKTLVFDKRLSVDAAVYDIEWKSIQLNNSTPTGVAYLANGGTARSQGLELTLAYAPVQSLRLGLNAAFTDARLTHDAPTLDGVSGNALPGISRVTWAGSADTYFALPRAWRGHVGGDYRWTGDRTSSFSASPTSWREGSYGVLGLNADVSRDIWTLRVYAKNLTNEHPELNIGYLQNAASGAIANLQSSSLQPRTLGFEVDAQF